MRCCSHSRCSGRAHSLSHSTLSTVTGRLAVSDCSLELLWLPAFGKAGIVTPAKDADLSSAARTGTT